MVTLYGTSKSRALRSLWAIEEVGVDYEHVPTHFAGESKQPDYLALNPNGRVPTLVDGELVLFESMAINLYLARRYGGALWPAQDADQARAIQWSFWGISELEGMLMEILIYGMMMPDDRKDPARVAAARKGLQRPLKVLDAHLEGQEHLLGGDFTIADLDVAAVLSMAGMIGFDYAEHGNVARYMNRCLARPAFARARSRE